MVRITTGEGKTTPRSVRVLVLMVAGRDGEGSLMVALDLEPEAARGALTLAGGPEPAQPADEQGIDLEGLGPVDQGVEHLVVAGGRHVELLADGSLLGAGVLPPLALELEDLAVAVAQAWLVIRLGVRREAGRLTGEVAGGVHAATV